MYKKLVILLCFSLLLSTLLLCVSFAENTPAFQIISPKSLSPYEEDSFTVLLPQKGFLTITISDEVNPPFSILKSLSVEKGEFIFTYNALIEGGIPLKKGSYTLQATLLSDEEMFIATTIIQIGSAKPSLLYALPSSTILYQNDSSPFIDCAVSGSGTILVDIL
ncbi:MAG: hypothetical protein GX786_05105, partial [Clostridiales bacterium]|nr:hypothetical protein [Clostridiales bacterium]